MYKEIPGGTYEDIQTLKLQNAPVRCWIPPAPEDKSQILFYDLPKEEQYWRRTPLPEWWNDKLRVEYAKREISPNYRDPQLQIYRNKEWERRLNGVHVMINGVVTYFTGALYYYLQWWRSDHPENDGYPIYYDEMRQRFYFRQYCAEDPLCHGYLIIGPRGFGKSTEEVCCVAESITRWPRKRKAVIQSKSEDDAKRVLTEKMRPSFNDLPEFFKPISNHGTLNETMLSFFRPAVKGKNASSVTFDDNDELQNTVKYAAAKEKYLSGQNIAELINDEIGVTDPKKEADVYIRSQVNRNCVYRNGIKIGLNRQTTTVEEMDKGGDQCKQIWDESDIKKRTENGFTISGYYRYMVNDIDASIRFRDKFGFIDRAAAKAYHDSERKSRENNGPALIAYIRKNPRDESEIFTRAATKCHFDAHILNTTQKAIQSLPSDSKPYRQGMFRWVNNQRDTKVYWDPCTHPESMYVADSDTYDPICPLCRYLINPKVFPELDEQNNVESLYIGNIVQHRPKNQLKYTAGADPYENSLIIDEGRGSKAALYIKRKYDYLIDHDKPDHLMVTNAPALEYIYRPGDVYEMYDDIMKAVWFFGCEVLPEANKIGLQKYIQEHYPLFLINRPKQYTVKEVDGKTEGLRSSTPIITAYTDAIEYDVLHNGHRYPFPRMIAQLLKFDNRETTKFDAAVAWGFTLLGAEKKLEAKSPVPENATFYREYDRYGRPKN